MNFTITFQEYLAEKDYKHTPRVTKLEKPPLETVVVRQPTGFRQQTQVDEMEDLTKDGITSKKATKKSRDSHVENENDKKPASFAMAESAEEGDDVSAPPAKAPRKAPRKGSSKKPASLAMAESAEEGDDVSAPPAKDLAEDSQDDEEDRETGKSGKQLK